MQIYNFGLFYFNKLWIVIVDYYLLDMVEVKNY